MTLKSYKIIVNKFSSRSRINSWLVMICFLALLGCASSPPAAVQQTPCPILENADSISISVLPFMDKTGDKGMAKPLRDAFYSQLSVRRYRDIELHVIDRILEARNISNPEVLYTQPKKELGRILDSDVLILGEITTNQKLFFGVYSQLAVGATITIWDTRSGHMVWYDRHIVRLHEGGVPFSLMEIPFLSFRSGYNLRERVKMRAVDELSRYLTGRIPDPASAQFTSQVPVSPPRDETEITNSEITPRQQTLWDKTRGQDDTFPPMF